MINFESPDATNATNELQSHIFSYKYLMKLVKFRIEAFKCVKTFRSKFRNFLNYLKILHFYKKSHLGTYALLKKILPGDPSLFRPQMLYSVSFMPVENFGSGIMNLNRGPLNTLTVGNIRLGAYFCGSQLFNEFSGDQR